MNEALKNVCLLGEGSMASLGSKMYRKQILRLGSWVHPANPNRKLVVTKETLNQMVENFKRGILDNVPVPATHTDDASMNKGFVKGLELSNDGLDALIEFTDDQAADMASRNQIPGVSCGLDLDYQVAATGEKVGPMLLHVACVNHPYIKGMGNFESVSLSEFGGAEPLVYLSEVGKRMDLNELKIAIKEQGIDVDALTTEVTTLTAKVEEMKPAVALSEEIKGVLAGGKVMLSEGGDVVAAIKGLVGDKVQLSERLAGLESKIELSEANASVGGLMNEGKIAPVEKDSFVKLYMANRSLYTEMTSKLTRKVDLSEIGHANSEANASKEAEAASEITRLAQKYKK